VLFDNLFPVVSGTTTVGSERCAGFPTLKSIEIERQKTYADFLFGFFLL
jgi:hypothetical protein